MLRVFGRLSRLKLFVSGVRFLAVCMKADTRNDTDFKRKFHYLLQASEIFHRCDRAPE